jgi:hypothetical protein
LLFGMPRSAARLGTASESNFTEYQWVSALAAADRKAAKTQLTKIPNQCVTSDVSEAGY